MLDYQQQFIRFALECGVLKFGEFKLKSGRISPYFFNTGLFDSGSRLDRLSQFYAQALIASQQPADMLYGPAYKGIPLACATAIAYSRMKCDIPFAFNRKEAKGYGEGGMLIGAPLQGRVWIVDDVITAGTSVRESVDIIRAANATPAGVLIALDRQEKGLHELSAVQEVSTEYGIPVVAIISLSHLIEFISQNDNTSQKLTILNEYRRQYGIQAGA